MSRRRRERRARLVRSTVRWTLALTAMFTMIMVNIALSQYINSFH